MSFLPYEDVPLYLARNGSLGQYIFSENASISVNQPLTTKRQLDDNKIRICAEGAGGNLVFNDINFTANVVKQVTLGPIGGPPIPLATSIYKIEQDSEISFPNGKKLYFANDIEPDGFNYVIPVYSDIDLTLNEDEAQQGFFRPLHDHATSEPIKGSLNVNFYINKGNLPSFFDVTGIATPEMFPPIDEERLTGFLGDFCFDNAYLRSLQFSLSPNAISQASASFDLYGELKYVEGHTDNYYSSDLYAQQAIPHGQESAIIGADAFGQNNVSDFTYSINVDRTPRYECPTINSDSSVGLVPNRVTKKRTTISMSLTADHLATDLLYSGFNGKRGVVKVDLKDLSYDGFEDNSSGLLHTFKCDGVVSSQSLSVQSAGYLMGSINISQTIE
jgi:hypothetical protein